MATKTPRAADAPTARSSGWMRMTAGPATTRKAAAMKTVAAMSTGCSACALRAGSAVSCTAHEMSPYSRPDAMQPVIGLATHAMSVAVRGATPSELTPCAAMPTAARPLMTPCVAEMGSP